MQDPDYQVIIYHRDGPEKITGPHEYVVFVRAQAIMRNIAVSGVKEVKEGEDCGNPVA